MKATKLIICYLCERAYKGVRIVQVIDQQSTARCAHCGNNWSDAMEKGLARAFSAFADDPEALEDVLQRTGELRPAIEAVLAKRGDGRRGAS